MERSLRRQLDDCRLAGAVTGTEGMSSMLTHVLTTLNVLALCPHIGRKRVQC
jgi:hypothetical protein